MCAKLVLNRNKYDSSKQALFDLHWLPVKTRIEFKLLTFMYNCSRGNAPAYLTELLTLQLTTRNLRSSENNVMSYTVPVNKRQTFGDRAFRTAGPRIWNTIPLAIRQSETLDFFQKKPEDILF